MVVPEVRRRRRVRTGGVWALGISFVVLAATWLLSSDRDFSAFQPQLNGYERWSNWNQNHSCMATVHRPSTEGDIRAVVANVTFHRHRLRVVGSSHSFSGVVCTSADNGVAAGGSMHLLSLERYREVVAIDVSEGVVEVQAGITICELNAVLARHGLALPTAGSLTRQSIGGAIATATHGSSARYGSLSALVVAMRVVDNMGRVHIARRTGNATERELYLAAGVGVGLVGVISTVSLNAVPSFALVKRVLRPMPLYSTTQGELREHQTMPLERIRHILRNHDYPLLTVLPYTRRASLLSLDHPTRNEAIRSPAPHSWEHAMVAVADREGIRILRLIWALTAAFPSLSAAANWLIVGLISLAPRNQTLELTSSQAFDMPGPTGICVDVEYFLPLRHCSEALYLFEERTRAGQGKRLGNGLLIVRFVPSLQETSRALNRTTLFNDSYAEDDFWLSPTSGENEGVCAFEFGLYSHNCKPDTISDHLETTHEIFGRFPNARPHWGKNSLLTMSQRLRLFPNWSQFERVRRRMDRHGTFLSSSFRETPSTASREQSVPELGLADIIALEQPVDFPHASVVLFGATGNLAEKYLWQALVDLSCDSVSHSAQFEDETGGHSTKERPFGSNFAVIAAVRNVERGRRKLLRVFQRNVTCNSLRRVEKRRTGGEKQACLSAKRAFLRNRVRVAASRTEAEIRTLGVALAHPSGASNERLRIFYLSIPPSATAEVASRIRKHLLPPSPAVYVRMLLEKPFGSSTPSAIALRNHLLEQGWHHSQLLLVDHYLGKPALQTWKSIHVRQLTAFMQAFLEFRRLNAAILRTFVHSRLLAARAELTERETAAGRTQLYTEVGGVLGDVFQSHGSILLALLLPTPIGKTSAIDPLQALSDLSSPLTFESGGDVSEKFADSLQLGRYHEYETQVEADGNDPHSDLVSRVHTAARVRLLYNATRGLGAFSVRTTSEVDVTMVGGKGLSRRVAAVTLFAGGDEAGVGGQSRMLYHLHGPFPPGWSTTNCSPSPPLGYAGPLLGLQLGNQVYEQEGNGLFDGIQPPLGWQTCQDDRMWLSWPVSWANGEKSKGAYAALIQAAMVGNSETFVSPALAIALWRLWEPIKAAANGVRAEEVVRYTQGNDSWLLKPSNIAA